MAFIEISHPTEKIPIPRIKNPRNIHKVKNSEEIPTPANFEKIRYKEKSWILGIKIPRLHKKFRIPRIFTGLSNPIPGISGFPEVSTQDFRFFPNPRFWNFFRFFTRDFFEIFRSSLKWKNPTRCQLWLKSKWGSISVCNYG